MLHQPAPQRLGDDGARRARHRRGRGAAPSASRLPVTTGASAVPYSSDFTCSSRNARFSSTTTISWSPAAKARTIVGSSGHTSAGLSTRMPERGEIAELDAEVGERGDDVAVGLAGGEDAEPRGAVAVDDVEPGAPHVVVHRVQARADRFLLEEHRPGREHAVVEVGGPGLPVALVRRDLRHRPAHVDGGVAVGDVAVELEAHPRAAPPGQLVAVAAEVEHLLDRGGGQRGHGEVGERPLGRRRHGRRLALGIVTDGGEHAARRRHPREVRVAQRVTRPVEAGCLGVPEPDHAVDGAGGLLLRPLRAPQHGRREVLVHPVDEPDVVGAELGLVRRERGVDGAEG